MPSQGAPEVHEMIPAERRTRIVELLQERRAVRVSLLSDDLGVSEMTIRRDLERLEQEGLLSRMHGGAILKRRMIEEPLYVNNVRTHSDEKRRIAQAAAAMIKPGETVFLSSGTTATQVLSHVDPQIKARIVTHNLGAVSSAQSTSLDVVLLGGSYRPRSNTLQGALPIEIAGNFHASRFILGADALQSRRGRHDAEHRRGRRGARHDPPDPRRGDRARRQQQGRRRRRRRDLQARPGRRRHRR